MNDIISGYIDTLINFSNAKIEALEKILMISNNQLSIISDIETTKLFELIDEKQIHIDFINDIDNQFENILGQLKKELGVNSLEEIDGKKLRNMDFLKDCITRIFSLTKSIQEVETKNNEAIRFARDEIKQKIDTINAGKKVIANYNKAPINDAIFVDRKK